MHARVHNRLRFGKQSHQRPSAQQNQRHQARRNGKTRAQTGAHALVDAIHSARADILADKRGQRDAEREVGQHRKAVHAHDHDRHRHDQFAEAVREPLHHDRGHREHRLRKAGRQAEAHDFRREQPIGNQRFFRDLNGILHAQQANYAQRARDHLRDDRGPRDARTPIRNLHTNRRSSAIFSRHATTRNTQRIERIAHAAQDARDDIVCAAAENAQR